MRNEDASGSIISAAGTPDARNDIDELPAGSSASATGNVITGAGTTTGASGADVVVNGPGQIVALDGAGGTDSDGPLEAAGRFGTLTMQENGSYSYRTEGPAPEHARDVFNYTLANQAGERDVASLTIEIGHTPSLVNAQQLVPGPDGVVVLPEGVELSDIHVVGRNLVIDMPDGTQMVIIDGAVFVPQLVLGGVEVPATNLAALLIDSEPQPAAGPQQLSSGGNFAVDVPPLDPGVPLGDLIPPTELSYTPPEFEEIGDIVDREPTIVIIPDDQAPAVNAVDTVDEQGLPARGSEPEGSGEEAAAGANGDTSETTTGIIDIDSPDGIAGVTINGQAIDSVGDTVTTPRGVLTITSIDLATGQIGYSYTITDNTTDGVNDFDDFTIVVTDNDGDTATGTLHIDIIDDVPTARNDTDAVTNEQLTTTGNVMTGDGTTSGTVGRDTVGADDATLTAVSGAGGSDSTFNESGNLVVTGSLGTLEIDADGNYTYTADDNSPGGTDVFTYTLTDGDGDTTTATLTITVPADPVPQPSNATAIVDDDGLPEGNKDSAPGDDVVPNNDGDNSEATFSGTLTANFGTDTPGTFTLAAMHNQTAVIGQETVRYSWNDATDTLTATVEGGDRDGLPLFTVELNPNGEFDVTLLNNVLQVDDGTNTENNATAVLTFTATDADGDSTNATLTITFDDDIPTAVVPPPPPQGEPPRALVSGLVDEDALPEGNNDSAPGDDPGGTTASGVAGSLDALFNAGADEPLTYSLSGDTSGLPSLTSNGVPVTYAVVGNVLTASAGGSPVFTLTVNADGSWEFELVGQLDHPTADTEDNLLLDLSSVVVATDDDGDEATAADGAFVIDVDDDMPVALQGQVTGTVDEDGLAGGNPGGTGDVAGEAVTANGSVATLFASGADTPLTYDLSADTSGLPVLTSGGVPVTYSVNGNTLTASAGGNTVFTFTLNANGTWTFTLVDQLDHAAGNNENDITIDLSSLIEATDADGDSVTASAGGLVITIDDDTPVAANDTDSLSGAATVATGNVITDAAAGDAGDGDNGADSVGADQPGAITGLASNNIPANVDNNPAGGFVVVGQYGTLTMQADGSYSYVRADGTPGNFQDVFTYTLTDADGDSTTATLTINISDAAPTLPDPATVLLDDDALANGNPGGTGDDPDSQGLPGQLMGSGGDGDLDYFFTGANTLPAGFTVNVVDAGTVQILQGGTVVLTVTLDNETGAFNVVQNNPIDHPPGSNENNLSFSIGVRVEDADGDSEPAAITINVDDDTPTATATLLTGTVDEDGVTGGIAGGTGDVAGESVSATGNVSTLFASGADTPLTYQMLNNFAGLPALTSNGVPVTYAVVLNAGVYTLTASAGGNTVFTFTLNATTGAYNFTLVDQIDHPTLNGLAGDNTENDLTIALGSIIQATDADGDTVTASANGLVITVDDDTPVARNDSDSLPAGSDIATGNVITGANTDTGAAGADSPGADAPAIITGLASNNVPANVDNNPAGGFVVVGQYGTLTMQADGSYSYDRADGAPGDVQDVFTYSYTDADGDTVTATLTINISDDAPVLTAPPAILLDDDDVSGANGNPGGPNDDVPTLATGTLSASGGDGDIDYFFSAVQPALPAGFSFNLVNASTMQILQGGTVVLTITLNNETGGYSVVQNNPIEHASLDGLAGDNTENNIGPFNVSFFAQDSDGDNSNAVNLAITVDDDTPVATATQLTGTVDEDGVLEGAADNGPGDGIAGGTGDVAGQAVTASGSVSTLFSIGADGLGSYTLLSNFAALTAQGLTSGGVALSYSVGFAAGVYTLTATAGPGGETVFTFTLNASTGAYQFTLVDQLDHPAGNNENDLTINLSSIIQVTDSDGDSVSAGASALIITVDDDTPIATNVQLTGTVDEDGVVENAAAGIQPGDGIAGGTGDVPGEIVTATGSVTTLFQSGADEPLTYSLGNNFAALTAQGLTSGGVALTYQVNFAGGIYTLTASAGGETVFTFTLNASTGAYTFTLVDQLDHPTLNGLAGDNTENDLLVNLSSIIQATDRDGDTVVAGTNGLVITVDDDSPTLGTIQDGTANNNPGAAVTTGSLNFEVGADAPASVVNITTGSLAGITSGGKALVTNFSGGVLTAYQDSNGNGTYEAGTDTVVVFTLSVSPDAGSTGQYTFDLVTALDPTVVDTPIGGSTSFGAGPTTFQVLDDGGGNPLAVVSGYNVEASFNMATWLASGNTDPSTLETGGVNGSTAGWGIDNNNFDAGEFFNWDFGPQPLDDPDGAGGFVPPANPGMPNISFATFEFIGYSANDEMYYVVHYTDGTFDSGQVPPANVDAGLWTFNADPGKFIADIEMYSPDAAPGKVDLVSVGVTSSDLDETIDFNVTLTDFDGDTVSGGFSINVAEGNTPSSASLAAPSSFSTQSESSSLLAYSEDSSSQLKLNAANNNTVLLGAIAAAGLGAVPAAAKGFDDGGQNLVAEFDGYAIDSGGGGRGRGAEIAEGARSALHGETRELVQDEAVAAKASSSSPDHAPAGSLTDGDTQQVQSLSQLSQGTEAPQAPAAQSSFTADSVAMVPAEMLEALQGGAAAGQHGTQEVGRVLADALAGGHNGPNIDAVIEAVANQAPGAQVAAEALATHAGAAVSAWNMGDMAHFQGVHSAFTMDAMLLHHDAVQPAA